MFVEITMFRVNHRATGSLSRKTGLRKLLDLLIFLFVHSASILAPVVHP